LFRFNLVAEVRNIIGGVADADRLEVSGGELLFGRAAAGAAVLHLQWRCRPTSIIESVPHCVKDGGGASVRLPADSNFLFGRRPMGAILAWVLAAVMEYFRASFFCIAGRRIMSCYVWPRRTLLMVLEILQGTGA